MATTTTGLPTRRHVTDTTPYPWPWDGVLDAARTSVLVVEALDAPPLTQAAARNAEVVVATVRRAGGTGIRVVTRRPSRGGQEPSFESGRDFTARRAAIIPVDDVVSAVGVDGFFGSALETLLRRRRVERLILLGSWLETSVHSTMRTANDMGFECLLVIDACAAIDAGIEHNSVSMIEMSGGIFGAVGRTAAVVEAYAAAEGVSA